MKKKLTIAAVLFVLFLVLIAAMSRVDVAAIGPQGSQIGLSHINQGVHNALGVHLSLYKATKLLGYAAILLAFCFVLLGMVQWLRRHSLRQVDGVLWKLGALYIAMLALYVFFEKVPINYRPILLEGETQPAASFPSTHTLLFCTVLGSAALVAGKYLNRGKRPVQVVCWALAALGVAGRLISGVHWFTDIVGGVLLSAALLLVFSALPEPGK